MKAIGIIILGLLLSSNAYAEILRYKCKPYSIFEDVKIILDLNSSANVVNSALTQINKETTGNIVTRKYKVFTIDDEKLTYGSTWLTRASHSFNYASDGKIRYSSPSVYTYMTDCELTSGDIEIAKKPKTKKPKKKKPKPVEEDDLITIGSGSGFFVSNRGHVVSNDHVVGICEKVKAYEEGKAVILDILTTDMVNDLGLIKGKFKNTKYLNIKIEGAELGEDIVAFGYPLSRYTSDNVKLTKGIVSALSGPGNNYSQIQIDAAIQPGSSGGPILNMNGQVVGVAVSGLSKKLLAQEADYIPENVNFAVAAQSLVTFLKANKIEVSSGPSRIYSTKQLAKIGEPATIQLFCMNTREAYAKLKKADKHSDVLLDLQ